MCTLACNSADGTDALGIRPFAHDLAHVAQGVESAGEEYTHHDH